MMIRRAWMASLVFVFVLSGVSVAAEGAKVAVVRIQDAFKNYERTQALQKDIEDTFRPQQEEIKRLGQEIQKQQQDLKTDTMLEQGSFEHYQKVQAIRTLEFKIKTLSNILKKEYNERMVDFYKAVYADFQNAVSEYARNNGYDLIIRKAGENLEAPTANGVQQEIAIKVVHYAAPSIDCTDAVVEIMNRNWRAALAKRQNAAVGR